MTRAIRGAITVDSNSVGDIKLATVELLKENGNYTPSINHRERICKLFYIVYIKKARNSAFWMQGRWLWGCSVGITVHHSLCM